MYHIYNIILKIGTIALALLEKPLYTLSESGKLYKFVKGQNNLLANIRAIIPSDVSDTIWIHAASLGEYGVARPVIKKLKEETNSTIVITFFSSTGYDALSKYHPEVDYVFYLPLDTRKNVSAFLDIIRPKKAIFIISEYWVNYLSELKKREIPTYLISAIIKDNSLFFKWYGGIFRESLKTFSHFMVLNEKSKQNLERLGYCNVTITGDPLFDNAITVASSPWENQIVEKFAAQGDLFIAGSISDQKDLNLVCSLANGNKDIRFLMVPHEISEEHLNNIKFHLEACARRYSECYDETDFSETQTLIIDHIGALAYLYRYAKWAYVGGGFTPYLHSIIEATVYGLPVSFGPQIHRKVTPNELIKLGIGSIVHSTRDIQEWFEDIKANPEKLMKIKKNALAYTQANSGATSQIFDLLGEE